MFDRDMRYLAYSARWLQDYGRGYADLTGRSHYDIHPDLPGQWKEVHQRGMAGETIKKDDDYWLQADGNAHWLSWSVTPWRDVHGEIGGIIIVTENITARMQTVEALRASEEHFRTLFEQATDGIVVTDARGQYVDANTAACRLLGYTREELLSKNVTDVVSPEERERVAPKLVRLLEAGGEVIRSEWTFRRKDGSTFLGEATGTRLPDGRLQGFLRDVTETRRTQAQFQDRQHFLQQVLDTEPGTVYIFDLITSSNVYINRHWLTAYGYTPEETAAMGADFLPYIISPGDLARITAHHAAWRQAREGEIRSIEYRVRAKNGEWRWLHSRETAFARDANGQVTQILGIAHDITERKQAEAALIEQARMLDAAQQLAHLGSWSVQLATGKITWNAEAYRIYGVSPDTFSHRVEDYFSLVHPDDHAVTYRQYENLLAGTPISDYEFRIIRPDGAVRTLVSVGSVRFDADHRPVEIMGTVQDITERKHAEELIRDSERKMRMVLDGLGPSMFVGLMTSDGVLIEANRPALAAAGLKPEDVLGKPFEQTYWWAYSEAVQTQLRAAVERAKRGEPTRYDVPIRVAEGVTIWIDFSIQPVLDAQGQVTFLVPSASIIDERKKLELELAASEALLRTIVDSEPACVKLIDASGKLLEMNQAGLDMLEAGQRAQVIGEEVAKLVVAEHREQFMQLQRAVIGGASGTLEFDVVGLKGTRRTLETHAVPLRDATGSVIAALGLTSDITARKRIEVENRRLESQLQQAQKMEAIGQLTAGIAHDFNNILASVLGYTGLALEQQVPDKHSTLANYLREVQTAGLRARDLIANLLAFSRSGETQRQTVLLGPLAKEVAKTLTPTLPSSIEFTTRIEADGLNVLADPVQLHQVIMNLVINARDALGEHGRIELAVSEAHGLHAICSGCHGDIAGDFVELAVSDNGPGIAPEVLLRMFDPFFTTKATGKGTGMGLSVVHGVVHDCGGHVLVESKPGAGTLMRVLLPLVNTAAAFIAGLPDAAEPIIPGSGHILVVDDEEVLAQLFGEVLKAYGYQVTVYSDSQRALQQFRTAPGEFDAVISDQTMPGLTGVELARALRALSPELPVILCTGYSTTLDEHVAAQLNVALLSKPVSFKTLLLTLAKLLAEGGAAG
ncbi:MAG: PAS domain S-box protein [Gammaproteobacteria bacterium]|nr:PAS domain S-box protein [Gammaproteobacteria bacterium]